MHTGLKEAAWWESSGHHPYCLESPSHRFRSPYQPPLGRWYPCGLNLCDYYVCAHRAQTVLTSRPSPGLYYCLLAFHSSHMGQLCRAMHWFHTASQCPVCEADHAVSQPAKSFTPLHQLECCPFLTSSSLKTTCASSMKPVGGLCPGLSKLPVYKA